MNKLILCLALSVFTTSSFAGLLVNGDFETGDFTGWLVSQSGGSTQTVLPAAGDPELGASPTADFYAFAGNQSGPSQNIFWQSIIVPENLLSFNFSFDYAYQNFSAAFLSPSTLATNVNNQQFRVDILLGSSLFDSTTPSDIVFSSVQTNPGDNNIQEWTSFSQDITSSVMSLQGQNILVRFAQADNQGPFDIGFDNVSIIAEITDVPEPSTLAIFALGVIGLASRRFKKQS
jgi:hypothetical protein